jgi:hypothetical protein
LDFIIDESFDKASLRSGYEKQVLAMFRPYVQNRPSSPTFYTATRSNKGSSFKEPSQSVLVKYSG